MTDAIQGLALKPPTALAGKVRLRGVMRGTEYFTLAFGSIEGGGARGQGEKEKSGEGRRVPETGLPDVCASRFFGSVSDY
jgi:hypothetical protein